MKHTVRLGVLLAVVGCGPEWKRLPTPAPATLAPNQRVQVWVRGDALHYWYSVVITRDSVTGIPYQPDSDLGYTGVRPTRIRGDTLRLGLALVTVDSICVGSFNKANYPLGVLGGVGIVLILATMRS